VLKEREPRYQAIRQRLESRPGSGAGPLTPAAAAAAAGGGTLGGEPRDQVPAKAAATSASGTAKSGPARPKSGGGVAPRPRKKGKRR